MERKIGEIFEYNGEWYQCIIGHCNQCSFNETGTCKFIGDPYCAYRNDKKLACFKKLEKVGEPIIRAIRPKSVGQRQWFPCACFQKYKVSLPASLPKEPLALLDETNNIVYIEIKEDLEEKNESAEEIPIRIANEFEEKLEKHFKEYMDKIDTSNLKPFDIQKAKEGKPVCTRDGRKARIIAFDKKGFRAIVGLVDDGDKETLMLYDEAGRSIGDVSEFDLMMLPEKKEGWVNVYKERCHESKEEAISCRACNMECIDTIRVEWEE